MVNEYKAKCDSCNSSFIIKYGRDGPTITHEVYCCPICKDLFSRSNIEELKCPKCDNKELIHYNLHKDENIKYYKRMLEKGLLTQDKYNYLLDYWDKIENNTCPRCGKDTLDWKIL